MKKIIIVIFAVFYLAVSSGFTVHMHYCMNKLAGWNLVPLDKDKCGVCGMHKGNSKGCCKDEHKVVKFIKDQKITDSTCVKIRKLNQALPIPISFENTDIASQPEYGKLYNLSPPFLRSVPVFILHGDLRI